MIRSINPLVSMIVLSYNQSRFVVETLESVRSQTYEPTELIIVDDCSSDNSVATIERWIQKSGIHCTFIRHDTNRGICKSLNEALAVANGKYISMVASDDVWLPAKTASQVEIMESQPNDVGILYSDAFKIDECGRTLPGLYIASSSHWNLPVMPQGRILNKLLENNFIPGMTTLIRRSCYDKVGLYDESLPWEDWDMWMRIAHHYSFIYSPTPWAKYRIHEKSLSHSPSYSDRSAMLNGAIQTLSKQLRLGDLSEQQKSTLARALAIYEFEAANFERRKGNRTATVKHLAACIRAGRWRSPGRVIDWASLLGYGVFGVRRFRWWKR